MSERNKKRSAMVRVIEYFEVSDLREARACFALAREVMEARMQQAPDVPAFHKKPRKPRTRKAGSNLSSMSMAEQEAAAGASA
jgi:hypothetical protein